MKRIICVAIILMMVAAFAGCSSGEPQFNITEPESVVTLPPDVEPNVPAGAPVDTPAEPDETDPDEQTDEPVENTDSAYKGKLGFITTDELNVRESASTEAASIGKLAICKKVDVLSEDDGTGWCKIDYNGTEAYVASRYVNVLGSNDPVGTAVVTTDDLNMRAEPLPDAQSLGKLAMDTELKVYKKEAGDGWTLVEYEDKLVYVATRYLDIDAKTEV